MIKLYFLKKVLYSNLNFYLNYAKITQFKFREIDFNSKKY